MLAPWVSGGRLTVLLHHRPVKADTSGDRIRAVTVKSTLSGQERTISAEYFIDATEQGDLLPLTKTEYVTGFEAKKRTGELHAPEQAAAGQHSGLHRLLRGGLHRGRGSHDRHARRVRLLARLCARDAPAVARAGCSVGR